MIVNLIVNECQFEKYLLFGLKERHVAGNPEQNDLRRVTAFFLCEGWFDGQHSC